MQRRKIDSRVERNIFRPPLKRSEKDNRKCECIFRSEERLKLDLESSLKVNGFICSGSNIGSILGLFWPSETIRLARNDAWQLGVSMDALNAQQGIVRASIDINGEQRLLMMPQTLPRSADQTKKTKKVALFKSAITKLNYELYHNISPSLHSFRSKNFIWSEF